MKLCRQCLLQINHIKDDLTIIHLPQVRARNLSNILFKNLMDVSLGAVVFAAVGYGLAFGDSASGIVGSSGFFLGSIDSAYDYAMWAWHWSFAATAATTVSGCVAERIDCVASAAPRGESSALRGDAAAPRPGTWTLRGDESRRRRGHVEIPWRRVAAAPRPRGNSVATSRGGAVAGDVEIPWRRVAAAARPHGSVVMSRGDAAARDVDIPWRRVMAAPRPHGSVETSRGGAAAATWIFRGDESPARTTLRTS